MYNLNWSRDNLTSQKLGTFCEYYAKMSLASYGLSVYTAEVDDHGIDLDTDKRLAMIALCDESSVATFPEQPNEPTIPLGHLQ